MGARVIACASTSEKLAICKDHGADALINYTTGDLKEMEGNVGGNLEYTSRVQAVCDVSGPVDLSIPTTSLIGKLSVFGELGGTVDLFIDMVFNYPTLSDSYKYAAYECLAALAIPAALEGRDLIAQAKTGSGKTAAFALALLSRLNPRRFAVQALDRKSTRLNSSHT